MRPLPRHSRSLFAVELLTKKAPLMEARVAVGVLHGSDTFPLPTAFAPKLTKPQELLVERQKYGSPLPFLNHHPRPDSQGR